MTEAYSDLATAFETPNWAWIALIEQLLFSGLSRNRLAPCMAVKNLVKSFLSLALSREASRIVNALDVMGATTLDMRSSVLGA